MLIQGKCRRVFFIGYKFITIEHLLENKTSLNELFVLSLLTGVGVISTEEVGVIKNTLRHNVILMKTHICTSLRRHDIILLHWQIPIDRLRGLADSV